jgi:peptidyl-tRNA hydrolase, PTH1 family
VGFKVIELLCEGLGVGSGDHRFQSRIVRSRFRRREVVLLRPMTFMNLSGKSVKGCADLYGVEARDILVVHDDLDISLGRVKVTENGGAGGHKGVLSVIEQLGDSGFARVKIGIGRPRYGETIEDFVLSPFYEDEKDTIDQVVRLAVRACELFVLEGVESAMNYVNRQNLAKEVNI